MTALAPCPRPKRTPLGRLSLVPKRAVRRTGRQAPNGAWDKLLLGSFDSVGLALRFIGALGVVTDLDTGLLWMRHRWYCPASQRFISRDPIGLEGGTNLYAYVKNNPINRVDPKGLDGEIWKVLKTYDQSGGHATHIGKVGGFRSTCRESINCHTYAIGKPLPMSADENASRPDTQSHPLWNKEPSDELGKYYEPGAGRARIGDAIVYGKDLNGIGVLGGFVLEPNPNHAGAYTMVAEIQHSAVVTKVRGGKPVRAESVMGIQLVDHSPFQSRVLSEYPTPNPYLRQPLQKKTQYQIYHLQKGADPGRAWRL